ncbi:hypothetical protein Hamer_G011527 [Homarus americanus]|uniref:Uncharacterized protein n=1 Tax=Homarus americanus TaxID=6706 RepID=A0A8J5MY79_HOMAM|nr:hypothetical protein Hamer_G011527 [Homarus americanus]
MIILHGQDLHRPVLTNTCRCLGRTEYKQHQDAVTASSSPLDDEAFKRYLKDKEKELEEFYSTYDVWTGIRTAITLALFFVFTVTLILYKSKCKPRRKYELYPSLEDMPDRPLDYYDYWCSSPVERGQERKGERRGQHRTVLQPWTGGDRIGAPTHQAVKSLPGSVMRINCSRNSSFERDDSSQVTGHSVRSEFLSVPGVRLQSTGSSSDGYSAGSSSHDLPGEITAMALLGVPGLGPRGNKPVLQLGGMDWDSDHATAEWIQTIDINVIQPTPNISPCGSVRSVSDNAELARLPLPGRGRVASVISLDSPEFDNRSIGSDSVFIEDSIGDTYSSLSEGIDHGTLAFQASQRSSLTPSPRNSLRKIHSFRLGINPSVPAAITVPAPSVPTRAQTTVNGQQRPRDQRSRQKLLKRQQVQDIPMPSITRSGPAMSSLLLPALGSQLSTSCERLAAHSVITTESDLGSSRGSNSLTPVGSIEEEPMCAVFTVPTLRRCNSATTPDQKEEAEGWKRSDSAQNPTVRRSDSAANPQRQSSESSSGSDEASESVSFHLMVPALSIDNPSGDTSRASSPTLSPPSSPNSSPPPPPPRLSPSPQSPRTREPPVSPTPAPTTTRGRSGRSNGGRRVLRRQYSQCIPSSPTLLREVPAPNSLPTYVEENDVEDDFSFPAAPPPSPFRAGYSLFFRQDSGPPSPRLAAHHFNRQDSGPPSPLLAPQHVNRQDSGPPSPLPGANYFSGQEFGPSPPLLFPHYLSRQDSGPSPPLLSPYHLLRQDSGPSSPLLYPSPLGYQDSGPSPPLLSPYHLFRQDSGPSPPLLCPSPLSRHDSMPSSPHLSPYHLTRRDSSPMSQRSRDYQLSNQESSPSSSLRSTPYDRYQEDSPPSSTNSGSRSHYPGDSSPPSPTQDSSSPSVEQPTVHQEDSRASSPSCSVMETSC